MSWRYENAGTADTLIIAGTTLTDLPESKSKTGTAFYQTSREKSFDIPTTNEIWIKFDVYFGSNRWRAFNGGDNSNPYNVGVTAQTDGALSLVQNSAVIQNTASICKKNQLQTVLLHMISGSSAGVIEAWVDGEFIYRYTGDVNHGQDFADIYLQSDGAGTFFSNVLISDEVPFFYIDADTERTITNATWTPQKNLAVWLPFDESTTQDLCGNEWTAYGSPTIDTTNAISGKALQLNKNYLRSAATIEFGGADFTVSFRSYVKSTSLNWATPFAAAATLAKDGRIGQITLRRYQTTANFSTEIFNSNGESLGSVTVNNLIGVLHHFEYDYTHADSKFRIFIDGELKTTQSCSLERLARYIFLGTNNCRPSEQSMVGSIDNFMIHDGVALHTENFTPPTQEDYLALALELTGEAHFSFDADIARQVVNALSQEKAILFDGNGGCYGLLPLGVLAGATTFTLEAKFSTTSTRYTSDIYSWAEIFGRDIPNYWQNDFILGVNGGKLCFWAEPKTGGSTSTHITPSDAVVNDGAVHEVAVVSSEGAIDLYCDGSLVAHTDNVNATIFDNYQLPIGIGLQMDLYEARLWSIARTQEQIFADLQGDEQGLEAYYLPEVRTDNLLPDISGNENHATLYGSAAAQCSFVLDADTECIVTNSFGYEGIDAVTTSELIRVEDKTFNLTGSAFYSADLILPPMPEVWIEFSVYNRDLDGWQVGNDHDNFTGIAGETPDSQDTSTPLDFAAYNLNSVISNDTSGLTKEVQTFLMHMLADELIGVVEVWIDGVPRLNYRGNVNGGNPFDSLFLRSSGATCFQSFRISNTEFPSKQIIILDFDVEALVVNEAFSWSVDETHVERYWAPPGGTSPPWFVDVVVHDRTAWYQTVVTKAFDLPPTYHLWIDFDVYFDGVHHWRAGNIGGESDFCGITNGSPLSGFSNGEQVYPTANLLQATGEYTWTPVLVHLQSGTEDGIVEAWFNGDKVFAYEGNVNDGEPFADPVLQSDGAGTYFSTLLFSTNPLEPRRNEDVIYLCLLRGGEVLLFPLYAYETCDALALAIRYGGRNWYNVLRDPSGASDFYILHDETIYALTKG